MKTPTMHDNAAVSHFLTGYESREELCRDYPKADDILTGVLALRTEGCNSTWSLSPSLLLTILTHCPVISVADVQRLTAGTKSERTCRAYAQLARIASRALATLAIREAGNVPAWIMAERAAVAALNEGRLITATTKEALRDTAPAAPLSYTPSQGQPCAPRELGTAFGSWNKLKKAIPGIFPIRSKTACKFDEGAISQ
jgi:hypothetical protein